MLPQRSKHPREMVMTPKAATSIFSNPSYHTTHTTKAERRFFFFRRLLRQSAIGICVPRIACAIAWACLPPSWPTSCLTLQRAVSALVQCCGRQVYIYIFNILYMYSADDYMKGEVEFRVSLLESLPTLCLALQKGVSALAQCSGRQVTYMYMFNIIYIYAAGHI